MYKIKSLKNQHSATAKLARQSGRLKSESFDALFNKNIMSVNVNCQVPQLKKRALYRFFPIFFLAFDKMISKSFSQNENNST